MGPWSRGQRTASLFESWGMQRYKSSECSDRHRGSDTSDKPGVEIARAEVDARIERKQDRGRDEIWILRLCSPKVLAKRQSTEI